MAVSRGWVEIWSRPGSSTFAPVISNPPYTRASFTAEIYGTMRGEMILPAEYDRLDEIIYTDAATPANNVRTLARVFFASDSGDPVVAGEWFPDSLEKIEGPDNLVRITGPGIASVMQDARVEFYDWDGSAQFTSTFPDWVWGGPNVLFNPGFEDGIGGNDTFEVVINATGGTFTLTAAGQTTVAQDWDETNTNIEFDLQDLSTVNDVTVSGNGNPGIYELYNNASSGTFDITINGASNTFAYNAAAATIEAALTTVDVTGAGTSGDPWVLTFWGYGNTLEVAVDDSGLTGGTSTLTQTQSPNAYIVTFFSPNDIGTFTADGTNLTGATGTAVVIQTGTAEQQTGNWTVSQGADQVIEPRVHGEATIAVVTSPVDTGTYSLQIVAGSQLGGAQQVVQVTAGGIYQASLRIRSTSTGPFRFVIRDLYENLIAAYPSGGGGFTVTANTWTTVSIADVVIPAGVDAVIFRIAYVGTGTQTFYIDGAEFNAGLAETTVGDMTVLLMQDADGTDHASREVWRNTADTNTWLDYSSFDASTDSNSDAWTDSELALTIKRGTPYDQVLGQFVELGYEWEVVPDGSTPGNWLLNLYNADGIGQDRTGDATPQIFGEDSIGGQRLYRRHPPGSTTTVEGDGKISGRASNAGALTAYGRRETYEGDLRVNTLADASLKATQTISDYIRRSQPLTLTRRPRLVDPFPMVDYGLGDTVNVSEPPFMDKLGRRLVGLTWAVDSESEEVTEHFGAVSYTGEAALREGVYQLLSKFQPIRDVNPDGGVTLGGGTIPWFVAADDAPDGQKNVAGFLCSGTDDQVTIQQCLNEHGLALLSFGTFYLRITESALTALDLGASGNAATLLGMGTNATFIEVSSSATSDGIGIDVGGSGTMASGFYIYDGGSL